MRKIFKALAIVLLTFVPFAAEAQDAPTPEAGSALVQELMDAAATSYADPAASETEKRAAFRTLVVDAFAGDFMANQTIRGREDEFTPEQLAAFRSAFPAYFANSFANQFGDIAGRPFEIYETRAVGSRDLVVRMKISRENAADVPIDWRVREFDGEAKVIDIIANGSSLLLARRRDVAGALKAQGPDGLIEAISIEE